MSEVLAHDEHCSVGKVDEMRVPVLEIIGRTALADVTSCAGRESVTTDYRALVAQSRRTFSRQQMTTMSPSHPIKSTNRNFRFQAFTGLTEMTAVGREANVHYEATDRPLWAVCLQLEWEDIRTAFGKSDCAVAANGALQNHPQPQSCHRWASNITATRLRMSTGSPSDRTLHARIRSCILTRTATRTSSGCAQKAL